MSEAAPALTCGLINSVMAPLGQTPPIVRSSGFKDRQRSLRERSDVDGQPEMVTSREASHQFCCRSQPSEEDGIRSRYVQENINSRKLHTREDFRSSELMALSPLLLSHHRYHHALNLQLTRRNQIWIPRV